MADPTPAPACTVNGCEKPARSAHAVYCKMHYHRWYRHGSVEVAAGKVPTPSVSHGRRYKTMPAKGHPMAGKNGRAYVHRVVLFDLIGPGTHACHWCGTSVTWAPKGTPGILVPDHLNGYGDDNRSENLVPSCMSCNSTRALQAKSDAMRAVGWWSNHDTIERLTRQQRKPRIIQRAA